MSSTGDSHRRHELNADNQRALAAALGGTWGAQGGPFPPTLPPGQEKWAYLIWGWGWEGGSARQGA